MATVVEELENALILQELVSSFTYYKEIVESAEPLLNYRSYGELMQLLFKGVLLNKGKTWFSINKKGEHCEMRSFADCVEEYDRYIDSHYFGYYHDRVRKRSKYQSEYNNSRFVGGTYYFQNGSGAVKTRVEAQFLSPGITYTVNLVFKYMLPMKKARKDHQYIKLDYSLNDRYYENNLAYFACERKDGWWMCELCHFTSDQRKVGFSFQFHKHDDDEEFIEAEGIEFWPLEKVDDQRQPILDTDANWEENLPSDYEDMMKWSTNSMQWTTEKEAYSLLRKGFLIDDDGKKWFSLDKNGKKCHMLSAVNVSFPVKVLPSPKARFGEVVQCGYRRTLYMSTNIESTLVISAQTTYASYLVYKLLPQSIMKAPYIVRDRNKDYLNSEDARFWHIYLTSPQTPVLEPKADQNTHNPPNRLKITSLPRERHDGWMEVQIWKFQTDTTNAPVPMNLELESCGTKSLNSLGGLIIEGIEFRPV
ncbi:hypothetical protein SSX86_030265 [Deinandra increscens subsp. villosa]|uniref:Uncharacterized protein n=1 Tax=Deinandra increscens subsp. villosa TaxID=3103831 RepID=A0AAP0CB55_9ASTR